MEGWLTNPNWKPKRLSVDGIVHAQLEYVVPDRPLTIVHQLLPLQKRRTVPERAVARPARFAGRARARGGQYGRRAGRLGQRPEGAGEGRRTEAPAGQSEKDAKLAQKLGQLQLFIAVSP